MKKLRYCRTYDTRKQHKRIIGRIVTLEEKFNVILDGQSIQNENSPDTNDWTQPNSTINEAIFSDSNQILADKYLNIEANQTFEGKSYILED